MSSISQEALNFPLASGDNTSITSMDFIRDRPLQNTRNDKISTDIDKHTDNSGLSLAKTTTDVQTQTPDTSINTGLNVDSSENCEINVKTQSNDAYMLSNLSPQDRLGHEIAGQPSFGSGVAHFRSPDQCSHLVDQKASFTLRSTSFNDAEARYSGVLVTDAEDILDSSTREQGHEETPDSLDTKVLTTIEGVDDIVEPKSLSTTSNEQDGDFHVTAAIVYDSQRLSSQELSSSPLNHPSSPVPPSSSPHLFAHSSSPPSSPVPLTSSLLSESYFRKSPSHTATLPPSINVPKPALSNNRVNDISDIENISGEASIQQDEVEKHEGSITGIVSSPANAIASEEMNDTRSIMNNESVSSHSICRDTKPRVYVLPNPKRPTAAAHRKEREKLCKPFQPPSLVEAKPIKGDAAPTRCTKPEVAQEREQFTSTSSASSVKAQQANIKSTIVEANRTKHRTAKAAAQFKSPLVAKSTASIGSPSVRLTPTIQMLERKLQILKRAVKIKQDNQEDVLRELIKKWANAGQEIAWEMWSLVRETYASENEESAIGDKRAFQNTWGWTSQDDGKRARILGDGVQSNVAMSDKYYAIENADLSGIAQGEDSDRPRHTLGTMLRQLGIDPQTLGWNDDEETFKDVDVDD